MLIRTGRECERYGTDIQIRKGYGCVVSLGMLQVFRPGPRTRENSTEKSEAQSHPSGIRIAARRDFSEDSMKRVFLLIVVPALLVAMGFAQTPAASGNTDQINVKGCLGGTDANYTVAEDNTGKIFKITTSTADLKAYAGQEVKLVGHSGIGENSFAVTEVNMVSEHCAVASAAPAGSVSAPAETTSTPPAAAVAPAAAAPAAAPDATVNAPSETAIAPPAATAAPVAAPDATVSAPAAAASTPPAAAVEAPAAVPDATVSVPAETVGAPATAAAVHQARPSARHQKPAATPAAAAAAPTKPVTTPAADAAETAKTFGPTSDTPTTPAAPAPVPPKASMGRSTVMLVSIVVVLLLIGVAVPLYNRWKRQKLAEQTKGQNLSFTKEAKSDPGKRETTGGRKAA
jgi:hypothetical protein